VHTRFRRAGGRTNGLHLHVARPVRCFRVRSTRDVSDQSLFCADTKAISTPARVIRRIVWPAFCWWPFGLSIAAPAPIHRQSACVRAPGSHRPASDLSRTGRTGRHALWVRRLGLRNAVRRGLNTKEAIKNNSNQRSKRRFRRAEPHLEFVHLIA
jgi:hypothetical protein